MDAYYFIVYCHKSSTNLYSNPAYENSISLSICDNSLIIFANVMSEKKTLKICISFMTNELLYVYQSF